MWKKTILTLSIILSYTGFVLTQRPADAGKLVKVPQTTTIPTPVAMDDQPNWYTSNHPVVIYSDELEGQVQTPPPAPTTTQIVATTVTTPKPTSTQPKATAPAPKPTTTPTPKPAPAPAPAPAPKPKHTYNDGTFTGDSVDVYYGNVQVQAVISNGKITDVVFLDYPQDRNHSVEINSYATPILTQEAIQAQSANVDIVSGATATSGGFQQSLASALAKAKA